MEELVAFVREALTVGRNREEIRQTLAIAGWANDEVDDALSRFADVPFPVPVPRRRQSGSARDAFLYLVTFMALYTFAIALGTMLFGIVDHFIPDPVQDRYMGDSGQADALRWNLAAMIVAFPVYYGLTAKHFRDYARFPERRASAVRRWLTYLTLFVAANVVLGTLIALLGNVLGGELAARFLLKALVAIVIAGGIFAFYLWEIRWGDKERT